MWGVVVLLVLVAAVLPVTTGLGS
ncbi:MAG: hypothetical protein QOH37_4037, partial [Nocardioidaceae bacterium]|nr:hypothetical protein [Nocardioidaceae bacterium]